MHVLALDTTDAAGSLALVDDGRIVLERRGDEGRSYAERLPEDVLRLLSDSGMTLGAVDLFAVARGPGSFTGLRIGIATIQGLAFVTRRPIVAISGLEALAHVSSAAVTPGDMVGVWIDARRREVFSGLYRVRHGPLFAPSRIEEVDPPAVGRPSEILLRWASQFGAPAVMAGSGAVLYSDSIGGTREILPPPPLAGTLGRMAIGAGPENRVGPDRIQPLYVRRPDAEIARDGRQASAAEGRDGR